MQQRAPVHYREYIRSEFWEERKRMYFAMHPKVCSICGAEAVELHHLVYGEYGHEKDKNLTPLCRKHHQALHDTIGVRKNTFYQSRYFVEEEREKFRSETESVSVNVAYAGSAPYENEESSIANMIDTLARPIWRLIDLILRR